MELEETKLKLRFIELLVLISTLLVAIRKPTSNLLSVSFLAFLAFSILYYGLTVQGKRKYELFETLPIGIFFALILVQVFSKLDVIDGLVDPIIFLAIFTGLIGYALLSKEEANKIESKLPIPLYK